MAVRSRAFRWCMIVAVTFTMSGCAATQKDWEEANRLGTEDAYLLFLKKHPSAKEAIDAKQRLSALREKQEQEAWRKAESADTMEAYTQFLNEYKLSEYRKQAEGERDVLRLLLQANQEKTIPEYEKYLRFRPDGKAVPKVKQRLRDLRFAETRREMTIPAYESFLSQYVEGPDVDTLKAELSILPKLEKSVMLGKEIMRFAQTPTRTGSFVNGKFVVTEMPPPTPTSEDISRLKKLLSEGADPNAVRVAGYHRDKTTKKEHASGRVEILSTLGSPSSGRIVRSEEGGESLLEFCRADGLQTIADLLLKYGAK